jgi:hypothetical protein
VSNLPGETASTAPIEEAERKGFLRGLNVGFVAIGTVAAAFVCWRTLYEAPRFEEIFAQVKVPMPGMTLLVLKTRETSAVLFLLLSGVCIWATRSRGDRRYTLVLNALLFGGALFWLVVVMVSLNLPLVSLMEGISQRRH